VESILELELHAFWRSKSVFLDCTFSRLGRAFRNLILASSMAIDFDFFFWSKDDIRSIIWSILSSSFRSTLWVSGLFLLAQQSLLARRPWVDHHEYDAFTIQ